MEYINVEKPFLDKLRQLQWQVIDQGFGIPQEPEKSLRENFKQVVLLKVFKNNVRAINKTADGREWLTEQQLNEILFEVQNFSGKTLHEANKEIHRMLLKGTSVNKNELTGEQNPTVRLIDFNYDKPESGVGILCVCDRLITGLGSPPLSYMILRKLKEFMGQKG